MIRAKRGDKDRSTDHARGRENHHVQPTGRRIEHQFPQPGIPDDHEAGGSPRTTLSALTDERQLIDGI